MEPIPAVRIPWNGPQKAGFRFLFLFFLLFIIFFNNGAYPWFDVLMTVPESLMQRAIPWVGKHILHLPYEITVFTNGSGDTTYNYVSLLCIFVISVVGAVTWSLLDRRRENYYTLYYWLMVAVRFYVALMLVSYGFAKIFKSQFPSPGPARLTQVFGNSSPMGLAWTYLGFSIGYNIFMGVAEVAAVLLLFRRTVTIGAIICLMTTANVMAVNYFYDVPVKIVSTALFLFSLFLLSPNFRPLIRIFFKGEAAGLNLIPPPAHTGKWVRYMLRSVKVLVLIYIIWAIYDAYSAFREWGEGAPRPSLYGIYNVTSFHKSATSTDTLKWRKLIVEWEGYAMIRTNSDSTLSYTFKPDTVQHLVAMSLGDSSEVYKLHYLKNGDILSLNGRLGSDTIDVTMKYYNPGKYRLMNRGFHWISEYPYNR